MEGPISQRDLQEIIERHGSIRTGATTRIDARRGEYQNEGYTGTMYYAETQNMMLAEDGLLAIRVPRYNTQEESNAQEEEGYVYVINGRLQQ